MTAHLADILRELLEEEGIEVALTDEAAARIVEGLLASADTASAKPSGPAPSTLTTADIAAALDLIRIAVRRMDRVAPHSMAWRDARQDELAARRELLRLGRA